jgi:hypothetical protein
MVVVCLENEFHLIDIAFNTILFLDKTTRHSRLADITIPQLLSDMVFDEIDDGIDEDASMFN